MFGFALIHWSADPEIFRIGPVVLRWYSLCFLVTFVLGYFIMRRMFRLEEKSAKDLDSLVNHMVLGTLIGARLGHCLFYDPVFYLTNPIEIFKIWRGGLASHGAAIGIFAALYLYARNRPDQSYLWILDRIVVTVALGGFFIRIGNFFNSEIYGIPTDLPWAVVFSHVDAVPRHPAQLYESLAYGLIFVFLYAVCSKLRARTPPGLLLGLFLVTVFSFRVVVEFVKVRQAAYGHGFPLSVGQWLSVPLILMGIVLLVNALRDNRSTASIK
ncbi:MAG: prolipoprotein diacylglyceryl transferase [Gemmatimonadota bacterium]|nr:prolipoprotein diacylglyceryl transferase [Gemmatimonadota bacterium]